jgi:hypothetical protein
MTTKKAFEQYLKTLKRVQRAQNKAELAYSVYAQTKVANQD